MFKVNKLKQIISFIKYKIKIELMNKQFRNVKLIYNKSY